MITTAFKSEYTGELFEDEQEYKNHLLKYEEEKKLKEKEELLNSKKEELLNNPRLTATSVQDFRNKMFDAVNELNGDNPDKLIALFFDGMSFGFCRNTHCSPISGQTNWSNTNKDLPKGYNGWNGKVTIVLSQEWNTGKNRDKIESILNHFPAFNTGSGGYRGKEIYGIKGYVLEYSLILFIDDFPLLKNQYEKFLELNEKKKQYDRSMQQLINEKNNQDIEIINYNNSQKELQIQINKLNIQLNEITNIKYNKMKQNGNDILEQNPFKENHLLNDLIESDFKYIH